MVWFGVEWFGLRLNNLFRGDITFEVIFKFGGFMVVVVEKL